MNPDALEDGAKDAHVAIVAVGSRFEIRPQLDPPPDIVPRLAERDDSLRNPAVSFHALRNAFADRMPSPIFR